MFSFSRPGSAVLAAMMLALAATALPLAASAEDFNPLGDGSGSNNADLLRDTTSGCENCAPNPPHEWNEPYFDLGWSLALRGAYVQATGGSYFEARAVPSVTLSHETLRGSFAFSGSAEIARSTLEGPRVAAVSSTFSAEHQLDAATAINGTIDLSVTQDSAKTPGTSSTIASQPLVISGDGEVGVSKQFGQFVLSGRASAGRTYYGPTTLVDSSTVDNSSQSNSRAGGGIRLGYKFTPILTAFVDGRVSHQWFDAASPSYLVKLDATDYQARTGLSAAWSDVLEAEASVGYGLRRFTEASLGEVGSILYDASVTYRPDETVEAKGAFTTSFGEPGAGSGGTARVEYAATGDIAYTVNPWLTLRASAGAGYAQFVGTPDSETEYSAGAGADYRLNEFTTATADYGYSYTESTTGSPADEHRVTLGVTLSR